LDKDRHLDEELKQECVEDLLNHFRKAAWQCGYHNKWNQAGQESTTMSPEDAKN